MNSKDLFSGHSRQYATFRPSYPTALFEFLVGCVSQREHAWDCGTGNGQVARALAPYFQQVEATDLSAQQLKHAPPVPNIHYSVCAAEQTDFAKASFDLITVGQALHWFDLKKFFDEVNRVGKSGGMLAVFGYTFLRIEKTVDDILLDFYSNTVGPYWDAARRLVEEEYRSIDFPFEEIPAPPFVIEVNWSKEHLLGYVESWSATQKYIQATNHNPVNELADRIEKHWKPEEIRKVEVPLFSRVGQIA
jgi:SAM-dependent methyltransferase